MNPGLNLGNRGEETAAAYLVQKGFVIIERNWRHGHLEIDLICKDKDSIVFVEVKTRRNRLYGGASYAVSSRKKRNLSRAADAWLSREGDWSSPCRFDVICLTGNSDSFSLQHYTDAFSYVPPLDSCDANWQY